MKPVFRVMESIYGVGEPAAEYLRGCGVCLAGGGDNAVVIKPTKVPVSSPCVNLTFPDASASSGGSDSVAVGVGVGVGLGVPLLSGAGIAGYYLWRRIRDGRYNAKVVVVSCERGGSFACL
jgi:hypothetical protein